MFSTARKTLHLIGPDQWRRWLLLVVLALTVSISEMLGAALVYVLVNAISSPSGPVDVPILGDVRTLLGGLSNRAILIGLVIVLASFFLIRAFVRVGTTYAQARIAYNAGARLSNRLVLGYLQAPYEYHIVRSSATLIRNSHVAVNQVVSEVFLPLIRISSESLIVLGLLGLMLSIAPVASIIAVGVIGVSAGVLLVVIQPRMKRLGRMAHSTNQETLSTLQQALQGIRDVKVLGREHWFGRVYAKSRLRMARAYYLRNALAEIPRTLIELSLIGFILLYFGVTLFTNLGTQTTLSVLGLFAYVGLRLQPSIQQIVAGVNSIKYASAPVDDLDWDLRQIEERGADAPAERLPFEHSIVLRNVSFEYQGSHEVALRNINLKIRKGEQLGICGQTGGGKTTLVDVISGLLKPTSGELIVDGRTINDNVREWQANLGVVPQDIFLLDDTLQRNIAFGVADSEVDMGSIYEALDLAQIGEFVDSLPDRLETRVGERGVRLSGGQRQRIAIARALYRRPEVLIFDEGTSALDHETEAALMEAIESFRGSHTIILIAHRLTTVRNSDRVVVIDQGRAVADGPFEAITKRAL